MSKLFLVAAATAGVLAALPSGAGAVELKFLSPPSLKSVLDVLAPQYERQSGDKLAIDWELIPAMKRQIDGGIAFDLAVMTNELMDEVIRSGKVVAASRSEFARTSIGVAVRKGAPHPDLASVESTKRALLDAKLIAYTSDGALGNAFLAMLDRIGIAAAVKPRLKPMAGGTTVEPVVKGEADLAITTVPSILAEPGVELAGRLPPELQTYVVYTAGVATASPNAAAATAFVKALTSPAAVQIMAAKGLDLATR
jgi:molybdate transport system substrate-binding protein